MGLNQRLQTWQNDLIDMSRNNNLLFYRTSGRIKSGIQFLDDIEPLYTRLAYSKRALPVSQLHSDMEPEDLIKRLNALRTRARDDLSERGINTLYCAFGILEWREAPHSDESVRSPLVLVPVTLTRNGVLGEMHLQRLGDEDVEVNPTLRAKLEHDFRIQLPAYDALKAEFETRHRGTSELEPEQQDNARSEPRHPSLSWLLARLEQAIPADMRWKVVPEVHLSRFSFQKLVMYQDLVRHRDEIGRHEVLRLLGGELRPSPLPADLPTPHTMDQHIRPHDSLEILDADSSQQEAIVLAKRDVSFVLQGPPGTGKSQTIANIIAECLGIGKRVLFVSEKMAALQVVCARLTAAGLDAFCLDLHDARADKKVFIKELAEAVKQADTRDSRLVDSRGWEQEAERLLSVRDRLNAYVQELHDPITALHRTPFEVYGELVRLHDVPDRDFALPAVDTITPATFDHMRLLLRDLVEYVDILDSYDTHPWHATLVTRYTHELASSIRDHFGRLLDTQGRLEQDLVALLETIGEADASLTYGTADCAIQRATTALTTPLPPRRWFDNSERALIQPLVREARQRCEVYRADCRQLGQVYDAGILELDHASLLAALTDECAAAMATLQPYGRDPHDIALMHRDEIESHLRSAGQLLADLVPVSEQLAQLAHLPPPATAAELDLLIRVSGCFLRTPRPPARWLDPHEFAVVRAVGLDALEHHASREQLHASLAAHYQPAYFELDPRPIVLRFKQYYQSPLRFMRPQYHRDCRRLRRLVAPGQTRTVAELEDDCARALRLWDENALLADRRVEYARILGQFFDGDRTDWQRVRHALDWSTELHSFGVQLPPAVCDLLAGPPQALAALRAAHATAFRLWHEWQMETDFLSRALVIDRLLPVGSTMETVHLDVLLSALAELHDTLRAFWSAAEKVMQFRLPSPGATDHRSWQALCDDVRCARGTISQQMWIEAHSEALSEVLGPRYQGLETDWIEVQSALDWTERLVALYSPMPIPDALTSLICEGRSDADRARFEVSVAAVRAEHDTLGAEWNYVDTILPRSTLLPPDCSFERAPMSALRTRVQNLLDTLPSLERWVACAERIHAAEESGLGSVVRVALRDRPFPRDLERIFERRFYSIWLDHALERKPDLHRFRGESHERLISDFRTRDERHAVLARKRLGSQLATRRQRALSFDTTTQENARADAILAVRREVTLKRHGAIRTIVRRITPALLEFKPCWMMSPLSVSQFIESGEPLFDVVIFDEASQVSAEDAICAILRGRQLIVVGDSMQLPPTRFFSKSLADTPEDDDMEGSGDGSEERRESILGECLSAGLHERSLRWHYRSRHESLIAFSNHHFYANRLVTFPSPDGAHSAGVRFVYVADGVYDRSKSRTNRREAERVADLVVAHARAHGTLRGLGVVALSQAQQQAIRDELETRVKRQPDLRRWEREIDGDDRDGFFVKNLESVQGDERDVIILSVGYGPEAAGGRVHTNFGPVNRAGGERRLNVAVTRAREQVILVSSMHAADLPADMGSLGARTLRHYLEYAEHGPRVLPSQTTPGIEGDPENRFDSPFEASVYRALIAKGLQIEPQVGCSGFRIDLAVRDPEFPGRYLLGIECDGATYHSSATARDRDRLRQRHLESMGWQIHRIWSRDWVLDPGGQVEKILQRLDTIRRAPTVSNTGLLASKRQEQLVERGQRHDEPVSDNDARVRQIAHRNALREVEQAQELKAKGGTLSVTRGRRLCETCRYYVPQTASRFLCSIDRTVKVRGQGGVTVGCPAWQMREAGSA